MKINSFSPGKTFGHSVNAKHSLSSSQNPKGRYMSLSQLQKTAVTQGHSLRSGPEKFQGSLVFSLACSAFVPFSLLRGHS